MLLSHTRHHCTTGRSLQSPAIAAYCPSSPASIAPPHVGRCSPSPATIAPSHTALRRRLLPAVARHHRATLVVLPRCRPRAPVPMRSPTALGCRGSTLLLHLPACRAETPARHMQTCSEVDKAEAPISPKMTPSSPRKKCHIQHCILMVSTLCLSSFNI